MASGVNPTKEAGTSNLAPRLQQMLDGWRKVDPAPTKMLPVEADVPEELARIGRDPNASPLEKAVGDTSLYAFYYLLRTGECTVKGTRDETKQTVQF